MATRLYFFRNLDPGITPAFGAWTRTDEATRRICAPWYDGLAGVGPAAGGGVNRAANETILIRQYISVPMVAGVVFQSGITTVKGQIRCGESGANDNINRQPILLKVVDREGTTLQATLLALAHYGPATTEWPAPPTLATNRILADGDALTASYTTVGGDRLVLELGAQVSSAGGTSVTATQTYVASPTSGDLPEDETTTTNLNPWFEFSIDITFESPLDSWYQQSLEPLRKLYIIPQPTIVLPILIAAPVFADSWYQQQNLPLTVRPALPVEQPFVPMVAPPAPPAVDGRIVVQHDFDLIIPPSGTIMY